MELERRDRIVQPIRCANQLREERMEADTSLARVSGQTSGAV